MDHEGSEDRAGCRLGDGPGRDDGGAGRTRDPTRADRDEGLRLYEAGQFAEAIPYFDRVLERHHRDIEVRLKRGACYRRRPTSPQKALADFDWVNGYSAWPRKSSAAGSTDHGRRHRRQSRPVLPE